MIDVVDRQTRSRMMAGIRGGNTKPERLLRSMLHAAGLRFRLHARELPGRPDIVLPRHRTVILVHGCFWHRHRSCRFATIPASNADFWAGKFASNVARDAANEQGLLAAGWRVAVVWECALRRDPDSVAVALKDWLLSREAGETRIKHFD
ncbi:very short patch repair endonuclease [Bosea sp. BK604]|uniref:very short patch repair endonuclease n=1 Tax=Bosea sp. BK604 TaxID=2512180 RepID=UPI001052C030|nr:very short patch repair endonuclease [Bosea sp. BK604]